MSRKNRRGSDYQDMCRRIVGGKAKQEENMIPMINVVFLLLLYFMLAGTIQSDHNVVPPLSTQMAEPPPHLPILIVNQEGKMWFENRIIIMVDLEAELSKVSSQQKLKIHADAKVKALTISKIMNVAAKAGILQFVLITQHSVNAG
jgi:biopolymer transport protein ExbD